ncbi:MAG TPA: helicase-related protein [Caldisericia bacterium]|nr:helicase-related protein [Caldisericia bacterium]
MPNIYDNIENNLIDALKETAKLSYKADFCIAYFNLKGWEQLSEIVNVWDGCEGNCARLLIGMHCSPEEEIRRINSINKYGESLDRSKAIVLKQKTIQDLKNQLIQGIPTNRHEEALKNLSIQLQEKKVIIRLLTKGSLHAKLYLLYRNDPVSPVIAYLGSSNLTSSGLSNHGELNIDITDQDACKKLASWFQQRWEDNFCLDVSDDLISAINESWVNGDLPYNIYMKIIYHLSKEARSGIQEFSIPADFGNRLFAFQKAAVQIATQYLNKRGGVFIGDVVGLGKTLMATAVARIMEDDLGIETLIICPKNLENMWEDYRLKYRLRAKVLPFSKVITELPTMQRFRQVLIDESHNLRNPKGKRYKVIKEYIEKNDSKCILLSATPYNKSFIDLSAQLRLFIQDDDMLGIKPEKQIRQDGGITKFVQKYGFAPESISAFEKSDNADDWRDLMRLFLVRRTRGFIQQHYAKTDLSNGRKYLDLEDGQKSYFPTRQPKTIKYSFDETTEDQYSKLFSQEVVDIISNLHLARYGLGSYLSDIKNMKLNSEEKEIIENLSRAGQRLKGFCRTSLFKRLESSGYVFIKSVERHILRNYVFLYALEQNLPLPIGTQDLGIFDPVLSDQEYDFINDANDNEIENNEFVNEVQDKYVKSNLKKEASNIYGLYKNKGGKSFRWVRSNLFKTLLMQHLNDDNQALESLLSKIGTWDPKKDNKLKYLFELISKTHPDKKILIFTQFADTVAYLQTELGKKGLEYFSGVTGKSEDPSNLVWKFSPESNNAKNKINPNEELRILIATDVLSEGQNLQDCSIIINFDLPWAIIRLIQRVGRVDRIGQRAENILAYSFIPADGVEKIIKLRSRLAQRLSENAEVIGTDEQFFEDGLNKEQMKDLYNEKAGVLETETDTEVDLSSYAYQIWKSAISANPDLEYKIKKLPDVVYSTKMGSKSQNFHNGVVVYIKAPDDTDSLALIDDKGQIITQSQHDILKLAECSINTPAMPRLDNHHDLVELAVKKIMEQNEHDGNSLGPKRKARHKTYMRLRHFMQNSVAEIVDREALNKAIEEIYMYPLQSVAEETINRQLRSGIGDKELADMVIVMSQEERLCAISDVPMDIEPRIKCTLGLIGQ